MDVLLNVLLGLFIFIVVIMLINVIATTSILESQRIQREKKRNEEMVRKEQLRDKYEQWAHEERMTRIGNEKFTHISTKQE